jgi:hypothetical protein
MNGFIFGGKAFATNFRIKFERRIEDESDIVGNDKTAMIRCISISQIYATVPRYMT